MVAKVATGEIPNDMKESPADSPAAPSSGTIGFGCTRHIG
jgi:hypothetical protein